MFKFKKKNDKKSIKLKTKSVEVYTPTEFEVKLRSTKDSIFCLLNDMTNNFDEIYTNIVNTENKGKSSTIDAQLILAKKLIFGIKEETFTGLSSIPDHNKTKSLFNLMIRDYISFSNSARHLNSLASFFDEYITKIYEIVQKNLFDDNFYKNAREEDIRFVDMINSFSQDMTYISGVASRLSYMISQCERCEAKQELITHYLIDSYKPSYFRHTIQLKNDVGLFYSKNMIYGETNNLMRMYDTVFNFIFGEFIGIYHTLMVISNPATTTNFNNWKAEVSVKLDK